MPYCCHFFRYLVIDEVYSPTSTATLCGHVAGDRTETGEALWDAGGVCNYGDGDCAWAPEFPSKSPTDTWIKSKGKYSHGARPDHICRF